MGAPEKLYAYSLGFFTQKTVRRILTLSGFRVSAGWPRRSNLIAVWGNTPTAKRGHSVAAATGGSLVTVEDAFIRSLFPTRIARSAPLGLLIDRMGLHFDPNRVSDLETILEHQDLNDPTLLERANSLMERMSFSQITKYYGHTSQINPFKNGYVLVIDQVRGDASLTASGATQSTFDTMLERALSDYPDAKIVIKTHPETSSVVERVIMSDKTGMMTASQCSTALLIHGPCCRTHKTSILSPHNLGSRRSFLAKSQECSVAPFMQAGVLAMMKGNSRGAPAF